MKTKIFTLLLAVAASVGTMYASNTQVDGIWYDFDSSTKTASVTFRGNYSDSYSNEYSGSVVIPSSVTYQSVTYSVTSIGEYAFMGCSGLTSVTIPNSVTSIGEGAFYDCSGLTSPVYNAHVFAFMPTSYSGAYTIPDGIESIAGGAFFGCTSLTSVTIPNSVTSIGGWAFEYCTSLSSVTIPNSVTSIGDDAFNHCSGLTSPVYNAHVFAFMPTSYSGAYTIPDGIESIAGGAFAECAGLTSIEIPNSVTSIGKEAFWGCAGLTSIEIPNSVTSIGEAAFAECSGLTSVTIPNSVTSIGFQAFSGCSGLTSIDIPNSVTSIGSEAFSGCSGLTSVTIGNSVTSIGGSAFYNCINITSVVWNAKNCNSYNFGSQVTSFIFGNEVEVIPAGICSGMNKLTSIEIPANVTSIGDDAFKNCSHLPIENNIRYAGTYLVEAVNKTLSSYSIKSGTKWIGSYAFRDCSNLISITIPNSVTHIGHAAFSGCTGLTSVTIPNSVKSIGGSAFSGCSSLTSVAIGNSVTSIGEYAFYQCSGLTSVTIGNSVTSIGFQAFSGCSGLTSIDIPNSLASIGDMAFYGCSGVTAIYVPCGDLETFQQIFPDRWCIGTDACGDASKRFLRYKPYPSYSIKKEGQNGIITNTSTEFTICEEPQVTCTAIANYGYHFVQWKDGDIENPRVIELTQDTTLEAEFAKNTYTISTISANPEWGTTAGDTAALYLDEVEISAIPNYGYHFVRWNDNNTSNPRMVSVTEDKTYTATFAKNVYSITKNAEHGYIYGNSSAEYLDFVTLTVTSDYGYHFAQWSDGNTDNPRTIVLTQDTTFTAEFAKNSYTISTTSANPEWGTTAGDTAALYLDEVEISAIPNYGYHFVRWNDYNTSNQRTVSVTEDKTFAATFAKNVYSITTNAEHGSISGSSSAEYLDFVTLTVTPDYGYHFTQWSDGLKDNPRIFQITKDTAFTAEFAYDRVGTCGKDLALVWSYDPTNKVLTIGNAGSFTENMEFGAEAPNEMEELVIGNSVTAIGANAFAGIETLKKVSIGESVKTIGEQAFYNCVNLETIFNYRPTPTNTYSNAFDGVDKFECELYVMPSSIDMYKAAAVWRDFYYTYAIGAEEATVTTNDVQVEPQDNAATLTWPTSNEAASYTIEITKDGVVFCTLIFNGNGQLTGIAFAPGREGAYHAPAAIMTANGLQFTVTGLDSNTQYGYSVTAKDANDQPVATYSGEFTTTSEGEATGVEEVSSSLQGGDRGRLIFRNGQIFILRGEKVYSITGQEVR